MQRALRNSAGKARQTTAFFFIETPGDGEPIKIKTGNVTVDGKISSATITADSISARKFTGDGSGLTGITAKDGIDWNDVGNKPATFTPSTHQHTIGNVTGLDSALGTKMDTNAAINASQISAGLLDTARMPVNLKDLAVDGKLSAANISGTIPASQIENGQYMVNSAGTSGQVWTSDGSGVGGWQTPKAAVIKYSQNTTTPYKLADFSLKNTNSVQITPQSNGTIFLIANAELVTEPAYPRDTNYYFFGSISSNATSIDANHNIACSAFKRDTHISYSLTRCQVLLANTTYIYFLNFQKAAERDGDIFIWRPRLTALFFPD